MDESKVRRIARRALVTSRTAPPKVRGAGILALMGVASHVAARADLDDTNGGPMPEHDRIAGACASAVVAALAVLLAEDTDGKLVCPKCDELSDECVCGLPIPSGADDSLLDDRYRARRPRRSRSGRVRR